MDCIVLMLDVPPCIQLLAVLQFVEAAMLLEHETIERVLRQCTKRTPLGLLQAGFPIGSAAVQFTTSSGY